MRRLLIIAGAACLFAAPAIASTAPLGGHSTPALVGSASDSVVLAANDDNNKKKQPCPDVVSNSKTCLQGNNGFGNGGGDGSPNGKPDANR